MSPTTSQRPAPLVSPVHWVRFARARVDAMLSSDDASPRGVIVGPSGAGKSALLRYLHRTLQRDGIPVSLARRSAEIVPVPASTVLLVDDAQLLDPEGLEALRQRIADPDAPTIVACRPWPRPQLLDDIARTLELAQPTIVLGHVTAAELQAGAQEAGRPLTPACVDSIIELTGGVTWLVVQALAVHNELSCRPEPDHRGIGEALQDVIAHRLRSVNPALRQAVEAVSVAPPGMVPRLGADHEELILAGHAEALLERNGHAVPVVRSAARATMPVDRLVEASVEAGSLDPDDEALFSQLARGGHPHIVAALLREADAALGRDPHRAESLYRRAEEAGADATSVGVRLAEAAWALGEIDRAGALLDAVEVEQTHADHDRAADLAAAVWAARGSMEMSHRVYVSAFAPRAPAGARALVAGFAVGRPDEVDDAQPAWAAGGIPSTLQIAMDLFGRGLRATLAESPSAGLDDLVRATEMYTASGCHAPIPELPAVVTAQAAIGLGELDVAESVLRAAIDGGHGGRWARKRLVLWSGWVALQCDHPRDARAALEEALAAPGALSARDRLLADAIDVALARRFADPAAMTAAWRRARESMMHVTFDLFTLLPLVEFVTAAVRLGESARVRRHFEEALERVRGLGDPPLWAAHLHWAGIQQGILENRPDDLRPHAKALVAAAPHSPVAGRMAQAGRIWTAVLAGSVDVDAVEEAALGLGSVGLAWDGARLAAYGAGRTDERRVIARLLACARRLHSRDQLEHGSPARDPGVEGAEAAAARTNPVLSAREREVALLVLQGKTYVEIGAAIFISPRTAEHHIARMRRRLGATTRSDLIAKLRLALDDDGAPEDLTPERRVSA